MNRRQILKTLARTGLAGLLSSGAFRLIRRAQQNGCTTSSGCERCGQWPECDDDKAKAYQHQLNKETIGHG